MPFPSSSITRKSEKRPFLRKCHSTTTPYQSHHQLHLQSRSISMPSSDPNLSSASPVSLSSTFFKRLLVPANWVFFYLVSKSFSFFSTDFFWLLFFVSWVFCELNEILNWVCWQLSFICFSSVAYTVSLWKRLTALQACNYLLWCVFLSIYLFYMLFSKELLGLYSFFCWVWVLYEVIKSGSVSILQNLKGFRVQKQSH